ncbi:MAG: DUF6328 family protein [Nocardioides sp.]
MTRDETSEEQADRKWADLLQELRVMQTGVQLTAGFLLTLPFQSSFSGLDQLQRNVYLGLVVLAGVTTVLVLAPVAAHRRVSGRHVKERLVRAAETLAKVALSAVALLVIGITVFIFDIVVSRGLALGVGGAMVGVVLVLLVLLPARLVDAG